MGTISGPNNIADGLVLHLDASNKLSYSGSGNTWYDLSAYSNNATFVDSPSSQILPQAYFNFDGVNDYMTIPRSSSISPVSAITQEVWFNFAPIPNTSVFIGLQYGSSYNNTYALFKESSLLYGGVNVSGSLNVIGVGISNISANKWVHFVHTFDGSTQKLYLDGVLQNSASLSGSIQYDSNNTRIVIGADDNGGYNSGTGAFHIGKLNQVKIYNRALSSEEITRNYISQRKRYFPEENIVTNGLVLNIDPAKYSSYTGSGTTIYDLSGFGNTGTLTNGPTFSALNGGAIVFDGSNDYVTLGDKLDLGYNSYSFSCWVNLSSVSGTRTIFSKSVADYQPYRYALLLINNKLRPFMRGNLNDSDVEFDSILSLSSATWYHITVVYERSSTMKLYINGALDSSASISHWQNLDIQNSYTFKIASYADPNDSASYFMQGSISNFVAYNRVLSATEISQNYNATKSRYNV
jgi:hypothetical protein